VQASEENGVCSLTAFRPHFEPGTADALIEFAKDRLESHAYSTPSSRSEFSLKIID
jgi:hypothetical protein